MGGVGVVGALCAILTVKLKLRSVSFHSPFARCVHSASAVEIFQPFLPSHLPASDAMLTSTKRLTPESRCGHEPIFSLLAFGSIAHLSPNGVS